jgi:type IV pilus biogenesis/stability protein PilW
MIRLLLIPISTLLLLFGLTACNLFAGNDALKVAEKGNDVARTNLNLGLTYMKRGEYEKSLEKLNRALEADPDYIPTHNALGLLYQTLGKPDISEQYFKKALSIHADDPHTLNNYGLFLCNNKRYTEAEESFRKAAANPLYETPETAITNAGACAMDNGHADVAEGYFRQALDKNPKIPVALLQMGLITYNQGDYMSARAYLQRYLELARHTAASLWLGIQIEQQLGDKDTLSSYALLLKNNFPDSREAELLRESGLK